MNNKINNDESKNRTDLNIVENHISKKIGVEDIKNMLDEILEKKFSKNPSVGYDPLEVDIFFDSIREFIGMQFFEYSKLLKEIERLNENIQELKKENQGKQQTIEMLTNENESYKKDGYQNQRIIKNYSELQKRVSDLETQFHNSDKTTNSNDEKTDK